ncbi:tripartite motif-containing protein 16-like [Trichomycterus rosablanca]|uniref:tripartite motif-containing protein 16-like n=1 Tax=Trichomycterus rosablanca TaxID=2290929 RepID=UPI002F35CD90
MAESLLMALKSLNCPVCLDLLKDPVTIPCGHSYCLSCIEGCWKKEDDGGMYSCPQCRQTFSPKPDLNKNTTLAELAEELRKTSCQGDPSAVSLAGPDDVECDICTEVKYKAVKSCLVCLASYCEAHVQSHYRSPPLKKHKLVEASANLQEKICSKHDKLLEIFCRSDNNFICYLCAMDEHKNHQTFSIAAERTTKQNELVAIQNASKTRIIQQESRIQEVNKKMKSLKRSAQAAVDESEKIFTGLIQSLKEKNSKVKELIRAQEQSELSVAKKHLMTLQEELEDLRKRNSELEQISRIDNNIDFIKRFLPLSVLPRSQILYIGINIPTFSTFSIDEVRDAASLVMEKVEKFHKMELVKSSTVHRITVTPKTREDFLKYFCQLTLKPNSENKELCLSNENRTLKVTYQQKNYSYSGYNSYSNNYNYDPPDPNKLHQVFCKEVLDGRCYWEVEQFNQQYFTIGLDYKGNSVNRYSQQSVFGCNNQSWSLSCLDSKYYATHNNKKVEVQVTSPLSKIGVYLNHHTGTLSFYNVSDTMTLIHKFQATFTHPLYAGFELRGYDTGFQIHKLN